MACQFYLVALGSNRRGRHGGPVATVRAAAAAIGGVVALSPVGWSDPVGPSLRRYANAVALVASGEAPPALLARLKRIEAAFGRRRGQRWGARVIDLDIVLWSGGRWRSPGPVSGGLVVPHPRMAERRFVLAPAVAVAPDWRDPVTGRTVRQLLARLSARVPSSETRGCARVPLSETRG